MNELSISSALALGLLDSPKRQQEVIVLTQPEFNPNLYVYVEKGLTKNMGDYNSAKVNIGITLPYNPTADQIEQAKRSLAIAVSIVDDRIEQEVMGLFDSPEEFLRSGLKATL